MSAIEAKQLRKRYGAGAAAVDAVEEMPFAVESGEFVAVMGESGSGKSTLLSMLGALNSPTSGALVVDGDGDLAAVLAIARVAGRQGEGPGRLHHAAVQQGGAGGAGHRGPGLGWSSCCARPPSPSSSPTPQPHTRGSTLFGSSGH